MQNKSGYWIGTRPSDGKQWTYTTSATVLSGDGDKEAIFRMYRRYVKQWNDVELDINRPLSEHTHTICGAQVIGSANRRFILHWDNRDQDHWILEIFFARGFREFHPSFSCGRNPLRTYKDIRSIRLHWSGNGRQEFARWIEAERLENQSKGEWTEYEA